MDTWEEIRQKVRNKGLSVGTVVKIGKRKAVISQVTKYFLVCDYGTYKESFSFIDAVKKFKRIG